MKFIGLLTTCLLCFGTAQLLAQEEEFRHEITVSGIGAFTLGVTAQGIHQTASSTGGVLATYRYMFNRYNALEADYGHAQFTQQYGLPAFVNEGIHSDLDEFSASYLFRYPLGRVAPHVSGGAGAVLFNPSQFATSTGATRQVDAAFVMAAASMCGSRRISHFALATVA